jgi:hypothetical protein
VLFDVFWRAAPVSSSTELALLSQCAERYDVSLIAATLRWLACTERRAVLVISRGGFILWARSSDSAVGSGPYLKTSGLVVPVSEKVSRRTTRRVRGRTARS